MSTTHNLTANGSTPAGSSPFNRITDVIIVASGTFGGGNLTLELSVDGTTWVPTLIVFTGAGAGDFKAIQGLQYRATLAGATAPNVNVTFLP